MSRILVLGLAMLGLVTGRAQAEQERIPFPQDYASKLTNYLSLDRTQNPDQIIRLFAPPEAIAAAKAGQELPYGTVLVAEIYKALKDKDGKVVVSPLGRRVRDGMAAVAVMQKGEGFGKTIPEELRNGDWDFAIFSPAGKRLVDKDLDACRKCHAPLKSSQYLFSLDHMR